MTPAQLLDYCLGKPGAFRDQPWEGDYVAKIDDGKNPGGPRSGPIFAFLGDASVGVKAGGNRDEADEWLLRYPDDAAVMAYIGRSGWNTLIIGGAVPDAEIYEAVDESYRLVVNKIPRSRRPPLA
ncbi:MmcQ/YjbR family DNA-binding protein [Nakamurella aerolata]|uniref:DNA-binding protein (MmcQ/YjbR family) n=1 Tax=Nakamurella aerolata TaxID=1656892 RepID=A0A849A5Q4_9ACTN|nr:hypothetical protein [Nakamurella aerolata]